MADYYERKVFAAKETMPTKEQSDALQKTINDFFNLMDMDDYVRSFDNMTAIGYTNDYNYQDILGHQPPLQLLNEDPMALEKLYTQITQLEMQLKKYNFWLYHNEEAAERLIAEIQNEYELK